MDYIIIFLLGLIIGSFLNCIIYRIYTDKNLKGTSFCPHCKHRLFPKDLVPILSWFILLGKCRYCKKTISFQYPLVELMTGLLFVAFYNFPLNFFNLITLFYFLIIASILVLIFVYDLKHYIIPDVAVFSLIGLSIFYRLIEFFYFQNNFLLILSYASGLGAFFFFFLIFYLSKEKGMGFGDVKYALFMGTFLGFPNILVGLFFSFFLGALIGIGLILGRKKGLKSEIPFAPFLITGTLLAHFYGDLFIQFYLNFIL